LVVRDPLTQALSEYSRQNGIRNTTTHKAITSMEVFETEAWPEFVRIHFKEWINFHTQIPQRYGKEKVCAIFYEELLEDVVQGTVVWQYSIPIRFLLVSLLVDSGIKAIT
jgi:hypothetical protein